MDSFELNKIAGAVLASVLVLMGINIVGETLFHTEPLEENVYVVEGVEVAEAPAATETEEPQGPSLAVLLNEASAEQGERVFRRCAACHGVTKGDPHRTGPNLYNTVGYDVAGHEGFNYSAALQEYGGKWDFASLDRYLEDPRNYIPGNKMAFAGLRRPEERAAVILYLNQNMDEPMPLPTVEEPEAAEEVSDAAEDSADGEDTAEDVAD